MRIWALGRRSESYRPLEEEDRAQLHTDFFSKITEYLPAEERVQWKLTCRAARDAAAWEEVQLIRTTFAQSMAYLHRIAEPTRLFSLEAPEESLSRDLASVNKKAAFLAKYTEPVDEILSPLIVPRENNLLPVIYHAYFEAIRFLRESDQRLIDFFETYLESHQELFPPFMEEELEISEKAQKIRTHLAEHRYTLRSLSSIRRRLFLCKYPPEALLYFQITNRFMLNTMFFDMTYLIEGKKDPLCFEFLFTLIETGGLSSVLCSDKSKLKRIFDCAVRVNRKEVTKILFPYIYDHFSYDDLFKLDQLAKYARIASRNGNEELVELLRDRYQESIEKQTFFWETWWERWKYSHGYWMGGVAKSGEDLKQTAVVREFPQWRIQFRGEDQALVDFFQRLFSYEGFDFSLPDFMEEETDVATKANRIREEIIKENYPLIYVHSFAQFPPEVVYFRMTLMEFQRILKKAYSNRHSYKTLFALIDSGKLEFFSKQKRFPRMISLKGLKRIFLTAVSEVWAPSVEILLRLIGKDLTRADLKEAECKLHLNGNDEEILSLLKKHCKKYRIKYFFQNPVAALDECCLIGHR